ncbi:Sulfatase arylsulfatase A-like [uncultured Desulfobacterium sp.]|uniref:Sulfatase arylsulfatase A-like n=1 Tax=uncultured Desulfobacterium sp. TaxID=201089 RepID=A0A445MUJ5_9BACT|nr:Sulfatase arylsulfatase A-like [uncultured Desulfobacterium sp.]
MIHNKHLNRRQFLKQSAAAAAGLAVGLDIRSAYSANKTIGPIKPGKKVIVVGVDGMDPRLSESMMNMGLLPNFDKLRRNGGYRRLGTTIPPQSPVAWASFINGAGPGSHGIFDFIHRNPEKQCAPFFSAAETVPAVGSLEVGEYSLSLDFWPFNHKKAMTLLRRQGIPFWDYLDEAGIQSIFYDLPSNYPPSPSKYGNHKCLAGMGTPDMLGTYGTYQHFAEDGPVPVKEEGGGRRSIIFFENETARVELTGPNNIFMKEPRASVVAFAVHRDKQARAAAIEIQNQKILLKEGQWSRWVKLDFAMSMPALVPDEHLRGMCRFYLQEVAPNFRLYVSPINTDPSDPANQITEPNDFIKQISSELGLFYTTGFQEDHKALSNKVFSDEEFVAQAGYVLQERLNLLQYAMDHYDDGLLFFYFSSTDMQAHMLWWDSNEKHPTRSDADAKKYFSHLKEVYQKIDRVIGDIINRYGDKAAIIVMSDHGFTRFKRQFNLNTWLRDNGYIQTPDAKSLFYDVDWSKTRAYGLGINSLYLNLRGRERDGIVAPGKEQEALINELISGLEAVRDVNGGRPILKVHRTDRAYIGSETKLAPDLIVGYSPGYRASWSTCLGDMTDDILLDNDSAWSADHCADVSAVPGVIFSNRPLGCPSPAIIDVAPSILREFGLEIPPSMEGKNILS